MSRFFMMVLWFASELIVAFVSVTGIVVDLDCEYLRPPKPGPGALIGVCSITLAPQFEIRQVQLSPP